MRRLPTLSAALLGAAIVLAAPVGTKFVLGGVSSRS